MRRAIQLQRRLRSLRGLGEAIGAMKSLSAHHFREARQAVEPARAYRQGVERIVALTGASLPAGDGAAGLLVIGAELGLCGGYNTRIVEAGAARRAALGGGPTFCVGRRAAVLLERRGLEVTRRYPGPTSARGITGQLLSLAEDVLAAYAGERLASFDIVSSRFAGVGETSVDSVRLLPVEARGEAKPRRARYAKPDDVAFAVVRELFYITLYDLLLDALASEHGARLAATQAAESWLDDRIHRLDRLVAATRREASTQEVIEIAAGARARNAH